MNDLLQEFLEEEGGEKPVKVATTYELDHAYQGEEAFTKVKEAEESGRPYAVLFMDVRMPPGWDGIQTIRRIWERYPHN